MNKYVQPLSIIFIWHPADKIACSIVKYSSSLLSRDDQTPFSRSINLPIFYYTSTKKGIPEKINISSRKTIIFPLVSKEITNDDEWVSYVENISLGTGSFLIPIAIDRTALNLKGVFQKKNCIRAFDYEETYINDYAFIAVAHEIYRCALNESYNEKALGKENAIRLFLSHAKDGKNGIELARALKKFIDSSSLKSFFDATDIAPGYQFDDEIIGYIKESTVVAIHSDIYSSRYWCQREILCAKECNRPIVAIDSLEVFEDRRFPFASNIPGVHVHFNGGISEKDLLRIVRIVLLETLRYNYSSLLLSQYKQAGWLRSDAEILARPPEVSDLNKLLFKENDHIQRKYKLLVYPDPPVYAEELSFLHGLGIEVETPLTSKFCQLRGKKIGISIANPSTEELAAIGQNDTHLAILSQEIARYLLSNDATLVYGGDFRRDGFTEFIFHEARILQTRMNKEDCNLKSYIAWPIYNKDTEDIKNWKSTNRDIAEILKVCPPTDVHDLIPDEYFYLTPTNEQNNYVWSRCLTEMRETMINVCNVRICAGGKLNGYKGKMPGVLEEMLISVKRGLPIFLLGGFGGLSSKICEYITTEKVPEELTLDWQIENNSGYKKLLDFSTKRSNSYFQTYTQGLECIKNMELKNGLSEDDNNRLFATTFIDEAVYLILKGLKTLFNN